MNTTTPHDYTGNFMPLKTVQLTNALSGKSYPVMETITICWDF